MNFNLIPSLITGPQEPSDDDDFNAVGGEIFATFSPWASWLSDGNPFAPTPTTGLPAVAGGSADGQGDPGSVVVVSSGGITINLIFDTAALAAPASFRAGIQQAVAILASAISDKITVNLKIDYSGTGGGAAAGPDHGLFESYSSIRADLVNNATPGDTTFNALAAGSSIQGQSSVAVWNAQLKLWGLMAANDTTTDDGSATFATDINPNLLVGVALHELTHAMGRVPYGSQPDIFDLFRFTGPGTRLFQGGATAPAAYLSLDGGTTKLADYGRTSDASDFLNSGVQGSNDPFNEFYNGATAQRLTAVDLKQLDALGFHLMTADTQAPTLLNDNSLSLHAGSTRSITSSLLTATDNVSSAAQLHYTVITGPSHGTLLLNGVTASSFTQTDVDHGLVSYHETARGATSDTFSVKIADAAGNTTGTSSFQINIGPFDALEYIASNPDLILAFGLNLTAATDHYFAIGINEHRATDSFDAMEYIASNPDLIMAFGSNTALGEQHYIALGFNEHRATNSFDAMEYIASNPDLIAAFGSNTALGEQHYVALGVNEHRATNSFDAMEYIASNPDLIAALGANTTLGEQHYVALGFNEHRVTNSFDALEYLASNPDLIRAIGLNPALGEQHYVALGFNEHRVTNSFNAAQYLANYPDLVAAFGNNVAAAEQHYISYGLNEGRTDQKPVITGDGGNNVLVAKNGAVMTGGAGADTFVFNSSLLTPATVSDFAVGTDHLQISASGFGHGLSPGGTAPLVTAATASSAIHAGTDGYFIFDNAHTVWWDPTGGSGADAIALTKLAGVGALHASDFLLA
jgi:hypothetical protein